MVEKVRAIVIGGPHHGETHEGYPPFLNIAVRRKIGPLEAYISAIDARGGFTIDETPSHKAEYRLETYRDKLGTVRIWVPSGVDAELVGRHILDVAAKGRLADG